MKCQKCGGKADFFQRFDCDGVEKTVSLCKKCAREILEDGSKIYKPGLIIMAKHSELVQDTILSYTPDLYGNHLNAFIAMPVAVQTMLFERDGDSEERSLKEIYKRELVILKDRLRRAVAKEDYRTASMIKRRIQRLEEILKS